MDYQDYFYTILSIQNFKIIIISIHQIILILNFIILKIILNFIILNFIILKKDSNKYYIIFDNLNYYYLNLHLLS